MATLYVLQSKTTGLFYIGSTTDLERRLAEHARGQTPSTRGRGPWRLVYREEFPSVKAARQRERKLKAWKSHTAIAELVSESSAKR